MKITMTCEWPDDGVDGAQLVTVVHQFPGDPSISGMTQAFRDFMHVAGYHEAMIDKVLAGGE